MKRWTVVLACAGALVLGGAVLIFQATDGPESLRRRRRFEFTVRTGDHVRLAQAALRLMRESSTGTYFASSPSAPDALNLPAVIADLNPNWVVVFPDQMTIEMHGGFDHFGFEFRRKGDQLEMYAYTETSHHYILSIPADSDESRGEPEL